MHRFVHAALLLGLSVSAVHAQDLESGGVGTVSKFPKSLPGNKPGTERWIVHFEKRDFDLSAFRTAIYARRPAAEVNAIVRDLEARAERHQASFAEVVRQNGGEMVMQWWLINACAIDIPRASLQAIADADNVARLEADEETFPVIGVATNASNHNADAVQAAGVTGGGVATAIMDTGLDENLGGQGRPHRTFYPNGDPNNQTGSGMGGSRLVINRAMASMPADDVHDHGTGVASIVAGGDWGTSGADHGHAYGANVAGYSIADNTRGGSTTAIMASAWQQIAADRAQYNIVSANNSYSGSPNPTDVGQLALDAAATNADILVVCAGGNSGSSTAVSQSTANGIAVAAVNANSHTVASFSSRGPLSGSGGRFYPDIAGCGVSTIMAKRDNETSNYTASGTSMAAPQVCGAATLLRSANPSLTALETKAALLASTLDISSQNGSLDRNAYGLGLLRDDKALQTVTAGNYGSGSTATTWSTTMAGQAGKGYAVVMTWHRIAQGSTWSDLALTIKDSSGQVLATADTPLNLYEVARFTAATTGNYTIEVTVNSLQSGRTSESFAYAFAEIPPPPVEGQYTTYGAGCVGSGSFSQCTGLNVNGGTSANSTAPNEYAYLATAQGPLQVSGFRVFTKSTSGSNVTVNCGLYLDTGGLPDPNPVATGTMTVGGTDAFYQVSLSSVTTIPAGARFYLGTDCTSIQISNLTSGTAGTGFWRRPPMGGTAWAQSGIVRIPSYQVICAGGGGGGVVPALFSSDEPLIGTSVSIGLAGAAPNASAFLFVGLSDSSFAGTPLPFDLTPLGGQGCSILASGESALSATTSQGGSATQTIPIPASSSLIRANFYNQWIILDGQANSLGIAVSNGGKAFIGG